jgi:hypothetical protein
MNCRLIGRQVLGLWQHMLGGLLLPVLLLGLLTTSSHAAIALIGDVLPRDNPFTPLVNEGLPPGGSFINTSEPVDAQPNWEFPADLRVGIREWGRVDIDGSSQLRLEDLIIGDEGMLPDGQMRQGEGWVLITGTDALFNNDPNIIPSWLPSNFASTSATRRQPDQGYNLYVGRAGIGTLEIRGGGRAEIQNLSIVGDQQGSIGTISVDGFASYLGTGGFTQSGGPVGAARQMIVGRQGVGTMTISNGGTVVADAAASTVGLIDTLGAVIGGDAYTTDRPEEGGRGTVTVQGANSKWIIGGSLQIGGFHETSGGLMGEEVGVTAEYNSTVGRGILRVNDGGLVSIRSAIDADPTTDQLRLLVGRFGRVELTNGFINVGNPGFREDNIQLVNDGVITGGGRIDTGLFRNRYFGEIRVNSGQKLVVDSTSEWRTATDSVPMVNWGLIEVVGTPEARAEIEFERAPNTPMDPIQPFINQALEMPVPNGRSGGQITAQHATLTFRSGLQNQALMAFTAGSNIVRGEVMNIGTTVGSPDDMDIGDSAEILVTGPSTQVVFEDDLGSAGNADINLANGGSIVVLDQHSFTTAGELSVEVSYVNPTSFVVAGDVGISGELSVNFASDVMSTLSHGDTFEILSFGGDAGGVDLTNPLRPVPNLSVAPLFTEIETSPNLFLIYPNLVVVPQYSNEGIYLSVLDPMMVGGGAMGPDFNGDGFVDALDLAIWQLNVGITMGASVLQGDADSDGDVDGDDFLLWQQNIGPYPGSGSGAGSEIGAGQNASVAAVPEPSAIALLMSGGLLTLVVRRKQS